MELSLSTGAADDALIIMLFLEQGGSRGRAALAWGGHIEPRVSV